MSAFHEWWDSFAVPGTFHYRRDTVNLAKLAWIECLKWTLDYEGGANCNWDKIEKELNSLEGKQT